MSSADSNPDEKKNYTPNVGLEPTTLRLRVSCSTDWASRAGGDMCPWLSTSQHRWDREENVQDWKQVRNTAKVWHQNWDWNWSFYMFRAIASLFKGNSSYDAVIIVCIELPLLWPSSTQKSSSLRIVPIENRSAAQLYRWPHRSEPYG